MNAICSASMGWYWSRENGANICLEMIFKRIKRSWNRWRRAAARSKASIKCRGTYNTCLFPIYIVLNAAQYILDCTTGCASAIAHPWCILRRLHQCRARRISTFRTWIGVQESSKSFRRTAAIVSVQIFSKRAARVIKFKMPRIFFERSISCLSFSSVCEVFHSKINILLNLLQILHGKSYYLKQKVMFL